MEYKANFDLYLLKSAHFKSSINLAPNLNDEKHFINQLNNFTRSIKDMKLLILSRKPETTRYVDSLVNDEIIACRYS